MHENVSHAVRVQDKTSKNSVLDSTYSLRVAGKLRDVFLFVSGPGMSSRKPLGESPGESSGKPSGISENLPGSYPLNAFWMYVS